MELKLITHSHLTCRLERFNRTFMELKHAKDIMIFILIGWFNRTFMELKLEDLQQVYKSQVV